MSTVFGRVSLAHPYDSALINLQSSHATPALAQVKNAVACNIRHDHRVSEEREQHFDAVCHHPRTGRKLQQAISSYFAERIRTRNLPDFVYFEINRNNLISGHAKLTTLSADQRPAINKEVKLARILDINNLRTAFSWLLDVSHRKLIWEESFEEYYSIPRRLTNREEQAWIDEWLDRVLELGQPGRERFIESVLDMLDCIRREKAFQPSWATTWVAFEEHAKTPGGDPNPDRWIQIMGMGKNSPEHWYIALKYTVAQAGTLARPTQLDAGWYEYHFPSSEQTPLESGGHPMDLRISPSATTLLAEYIHKQIGHPVEHWNDTGRLLGRTSAWKPSSPTELRRVHERLLILNYGPDAKTNCVNRKALLCVSI